MLENTLSFTKSYCHLSVASLCVEQTSLACSMNLVSVVLASLWFLLYSEVEGEGGRRRRQPRRHRQRCVHSLVIPLVTDHNRILSPFLYPSFPDLFVLLLLFSLSLSLSRSLSVGLFFPHSIQWWEWECDRTILFYLFRLQELILCTYSLTGRNLSWTELVDLCLSISLVIVEQNIFRRRSRFCFLLDYRLN